MILETVQTVAAWLADPINGVNAIRTTVPLYSGDIAPPEVTVTQAFRSPEAARGQAPTTGLPVLEVGLWQDPAQALSPSVRPFPMDNEVTVHVRYIAAKTTATDLAVRNAALTLRCAVKAIARGAQGGVTVNQVQVQTASNVRVLAMFAPDGDAIVTGALVCTIRGRDLWTHT